MVERAEENGFQRRSAGFKFARNARSALGTSSTHGL
jgi:hypothetical protein